MTKKNLTRQRHIAKTITWRIVGTIDTMLLGWIISGGSFNWVKGWFSGISYKNGIVLCS